MGSLTAGGATLLTDHMLQAAYTPVATVYLALSGTAPSDTATGASFNELANTGAYARTAITFGAAASRAVVQTGAVGFATATTAWGTAVSWAIANTSTYGTGAILAVGSLASAKVVPNNASGSVASGEVTISFTASGITDNIANELLDHMFRNSVFTSPASAVYVALLTTGITDTTTGASLVEPSTGGYARVLVRPSGGSDPSWDAAASGLADNATAITFATATTSWGTLIGVALVGTSAGGTSGVLYMYDEDTFGTATVNVDDVAQFAAGDLDIVFT